MTDLTQHVPRMAAIRSSNAPRHLTITPYVIVLFAGAIGVYTGRAMGGAGAGYEDTLLLLLRFMAAMKFAGVLLAAALAHWRFRSPIPMPLASAYLAALAGMAVASGLIWSLGGIVVGAVLFHIGLLAFLVLAWKDDGVLLPSRR